MSSEERPQTPGGDPSGEVFDLAPEVPTPRTKAPPLPAAPPPSEVEVIDTHEEDVDDELRENPPVGDPLISEKLVSWQR